MDTLRFRGAQAVPDTGLMCGYREAVGAGLGVAAEPALRRMDNKLEGPGAARRRYQVTTSRPPSSTADVPSALHARRNRRFT